MPSSVWTSCQPPCSTGWRSSFELLVVETDGDDLATLEADLDLV